MLFLSNSILTSIKEKNLGDFGNDHIFSLIEKLFTMPAKDCEDLSDGSCRDQGTKWAELTNNKNQNEKYHVRILIRDVIGSEEHQEKATYGLGYELTPTKSSSRATFNKTEAKPNAKVISSID